MPVDLLGVGRNRGAIEGGDSATDGAAADPATAAPVSRLNLDGEPWSERTSLFGDLEP